MVDLSHDGGPQLDELQDNTVSLLTEASPWSIANAATRRGGAAGALLAELAFAVCEVTLFEDGELEAAILAATRGRGLEERRLRALPKLAALLTRTAAQAGEGGAHDASTDRGTLRKALTEITDAADKLIASLPGHWHDDATVELTDAASDARAVLAAAAQNDLYDPSTDRAGQPRASSAPECCVPDAGEPSFVLLGRDPQAPDLVERWAADRELYEPNSEKPAAARAIAARMRSHKEANPYKGLQEVYTRVDGWKGPGRWETGIRNIVTILHGPRHPFEIRDIVEEVRVLWETPRPLGADPRDLEALRLPLRQNGNAVHDRDGRLLFGVNICTLEPAESLAITAAIVRIVNGAAQAGEGARG